MTFLGVFGHFRVILGRFWIGSFWVIASTWSPRGRRLPTPQHPPTIPMSLAAVYCWYRAMIAIAGDQAIIRRHIPSKNTRINMYTNIPGDFLIHTLSVDKRRRHTISLVKSLSTLKVWVSSAGKIIEIANIIAQFKPYITRSLYNCFILSFLGGRANEMVFFVKRNYL